MSEKKPVISHSQRFFRIPFVKPGDHTNNNTGDNMKVTHGYNKPGDHTNNNTGDNMKVIRIYGMIWPRRSVADPDMFQ